jgi:hypothetical protein
MKRIRNRLALAILLGTLVLVAVVATTSGATRTVDTRGLGATNPVVATPATVVAPSPASVADGYQGPHFHQLSVAAFPNSAAAGDASNSGSQDVACPNAVPCGP